MTFEKWLADRAAGIDARLANLLAEKSQSLLVPERLAGAMRHAVMAGGKRVRPFLVLESAAVFGGEMDAAMPAALALELVHCYSLAHDDLPAMDNDELRRGQPTVWKAYDEWTAVLAGDALLTLAFEVLADPLDFTVSPAVKLELVAELAKASGALGMVGGQCIDLEADKLGKPAAPSVSHIERLQALKTGALFRFACMAGARIGNATLPEQIAMTRFGEKLGAAFQLADDLLDVEGEAATVGKATGKDAAAGKATLIGLLGVATARVRLAEIEAAALTELVFLGARADVLRETMRFAVTRRR